MKAYTVPLTLLTCTVSFMLLSVYLQMVLAGQRPEVIQEIASRAIAFWTYQVKCDNYAVMYESDG